MGSRETPAALRLVAGLLALALLGLTGLAQETAGPARGGRGGRGGGRQSGPSGLTQAPWVVPADVQALQDLSVVLGRPTATSVTANVLSASAREVCVEYGPASEPSARKTKILRLEPGKPAELLFEGLPADRECLYRLLSRTPGASAFAAGEPRRFHTARAPGASFTFEIQGDSHPERAHENDPLLYAQTLRAAAADRPDFYVAMGDDFSVDTLRTVDAPSVAGRYTLQRPFLALVGQSSPLFLVNGNHEQAAACNLDGTADNVAVWAQRSRDALFPQPAPDGFYTGDATPVAPLGLLRDYYAWTWGDALFVVVDPYWHSPGPVDNVRGGGPKSRDLWSVTLGEEQYRWLERTLASSQARFKFVFIHHVLGTGRGGVEEAGLYEWGGADRDGTDAFASKRPGWGLPIQCLLARHGVTVLFQGHDHLFARQALQGVVYQTVPEPADPNYAAPKWAGAYRTGDVLPSSGRLRVTVSPEKVHIEYVKSYLPKDASAQHPDGEVAFAYDLPARKR